jgi:diguanylate cyclase (GGDEF)-like protein/PAS domain S-box-containing protein
MRRNGCGVEERMRKGLTFEAAKTQHRRRGRWLIFAGVAALAVGTTLSFAVSSAWSADRQNAAQARFDDAVSTQRTHVEDTVRAYRRLLTVTQGFFEVSDPTPAQFTRFSDSLELTDAYPAVIGLEFIERRPGNVDGVTNYPVTMVAPLNAAPTLLYSDLAADQSARQALEQAGRNGGLMMTPPKENPYGQARMQLVVPVHRNGRFVGWAGATLDPAILAREMLGAPATGLIVSVHWDAGGADTGAALGLDASARDGSLGTAFGPDTSAGEPSELSTVDHEVIEGTPWRIDLTATRAFAHDAFGFAWTTFLAGIVATLLIGVALFLLGRSRIAALDLATRLGMDLAASEARAKAVMDSAVEAIVTTDALGHIESANPAAEQLFAWSEAELIGRPVWDLILALAVSDDGGGLHDVRWEEQEHMVEARRKDASTVPVDVSLTSTSVHGVEMFTVIARDATVRKLHEEQLEHQATHDALTGLANRKLFDELLVRAVFRGERSRRALAVLYMDLDGFKDVNDVFGHQAGDRVLSETARRLESVIRPGDIVARLGGDEFVVLCENLASPDDAEKIATRVVQSVGKPIAVAAGVATVTASVGVAIGSLGESAASVVARADEAMYRIKQDGKAGYRFANAIIG